MSQTDSTKYKKTSRTVMIATTVIGIVILLPSLVGFFTKLWEFAVLIKGDPDGAFAMTPIVNYTLASVGFFCLLIWATANGMFFNIEGPKYTMLDHEDELDQDEINYVPKWAGGPSDITGS